MIPGQPPARIPRWMALDEQSHHEIRPTQDRHKQKTQHDPPEDNACTQGKAAGQNQPDHEERLSRSTNSRRTGTGHDAHRAP